MNFSWLFDSDHWLRTSCWIAGSGALAQIFIGVFFFGHFKRLVSGFQKATEKRRLELEQCAIQNQARLAHVHLERSNVIHKFALILREVTTSLAALNSSSTNRGNVDQKRIAFDKAYQGFCNYYKHKRLTFPRDTAKRIEELIGDLNRTALLCASNVEGPQQGEKFERRSSEIPAAMTIIGSLSHSLDDEFREIISGQWNGE
jgi:hypothetical protein